MKAVGTFKSRVYQFINLYVPQLIKNKSKNLLLYDTDNLFPNNLIKTLAESGTATSCVNKVDQFIQADGFTEESSASLEVNSKQNADQLLSLISNCVATFQAFSLYITRTADGKINSVDYIEFEKLRKTIDGNFIYNKNFGTPEYKQIDDILYPAFKNTEITTEELSMQVKIFGLVGEVLYVYRKKAGQYTYPVPSYYSAIEDIKTDAELSKFEYETAINSYITSAILTIIGEVDDKTKDDRGKTDQDYLDETLKEFTGEVKNKKGLSGRNKLTVLSAKTKDEVPVLQNFDTKAIMDAANGATDRIARKVARLFEVPPFLIGLESATGFNTKILVDQIDIFNKTVNSWQRMISSTMELLYPNMEWTISTFNPISYIPPEVFSKLTDDEIRAIAGYSPIEKQASDASTNVINAINTLSPLVANKVLESLTVDEIRALVGLKPKPIEPIPDVNPEVPV